MNISSDIVKNVSPDKIHQFDLHGCQVIDNYTPISCPPVKGIHLPIRLMSPNDSEWDAIVNGAGIKDSAFQLSPNVSDYVSPVPSKFSSSLHPGDLLPYLYVVCIPMSFAELKEFENHKVALKQKKVGANSFKKIAKDLLERRAKWDTKINEKDSSSQTLLQSGVDVDSSQATKRRLPDAAPLQQPLEYDKMEDIYEDDEDQKEMEEEITDELYEIQSKDPKSDEIGKFEHTREFLKDVSHAFTPLSTTTKAGQWINNLMKILQQMEVLGCLSAIVVTEFTTEDANDHSIYTENDLATYFQSINPSKFIPADFRLNLRMPAVLSSWLSSSLISLKSSCASGGVNMALLTPIPLRYGDHIYRQIRAKGVMKYLTHHGIYMGNGRIVHFSGNELSLGGLLGKACQANIRSCSLIQFMKLASRLKVQKYVDRKCHSPEETVERAETSLAEQNYPGYNLMKNNCEHFCHWCKTGGRRSKQVERGITLGLGAMALLGTGLTIAALAMTRSKRH